MIELCPAILATLIEQSGKLSRSPSRLVIWFAIALPDLPSGGVSPGWVTHVARLKRRNARTRRQTRDGRIHRDGKASLAWIAWRQEDHPEGKARDQAPGMAGMDDPYGFDWMALCPLIAIALSAE
jgi:hypothetical protein